MSFREELRRLQADVGELLERHEGGDELPDLSEYAEDPVGFLQDVLGVGRLAQYQEEIAAAVRDRPQVTVRSCHAAGKDFVAARLSLWWVYARGGIVVLTGPTEAQVSEILMRKEVRNAFRGSRLPGDLHVNALRPGGEGQAGILAKTATGVSALTGFHDARVLFVITEAQHPDLAHAWDAAFACTTGAEDRVLTLGNPTESSGRFYNAHREESDWHAVKVAAADVPNVREGETVIPGLLSREGVDRFASEYGTDSPFYVSRVLAEFPETSEAGLFKRSWLEAAADRWEKGVGEGGELIVAVDVARFGPDSTVLCVRKGDRVEELVTWGQMDTAETTARVKRELTRLGVTPEDREGRRAHVSYRGGETRWSGRRRRRKDGQGKVVVDTIGIGAGVLDRLKEDEFRTVEYKGSRKARDDDQFANLRAESYWRLRTALEAEISLPRDDDLFAELLAIRWAPTADGRVQIESKRDLKSRLGRSPDRADSVAMAVWPKARGGRGKVRVVHY